MCLIFPLNNLEYGKQKKTKNVIRLRQLVVSSLLCNLQLQGARVFPSAHSTKAPWRWGDWVSSAMAMPYRILWSMQHQWVASIPTAKLTTFHVKGVFMVLTSLSPCPDSSTGEQRWFHSNNGTCPTSSTMGGTSLSQTLYTHQGQKHILRTDTSASNNLLSLRTFRYYYYRVLKFCQVFWPM